ncbi:urease accessory protein [Enemella evansiae]|nr:urease accessory protein [Enemella evansiae]
MPHQSAHRRGAGCGARLDPQRRAAGRPPVSTGTLWLRLGGGERSVTEDLAHSGALRLLRPHRGPGARWPTWTVVNPGGGYLAGDDYRIRVEVSAGSGAALVGQSATKIYRSDTEATTTQHTEVRLAENSFLDWRAEPVIAYAGARYRQHTRVEHHRDATLLLAEIVTPGWAADGGEFGWRQLQLCTEVWRADRLLMLDNLVLDPLPFGDLMLPGTHLGSLLVFDRRIDGELVDSLPLPADGTPVAGASLVEGPGLVVRVLADSTEAARSVLDTVADDLRQRWGFGPRGYRGQW